MREAFLLGVALTVHVALLAADSKVRTFTFTKDESGKVRYAVYRGEEEGIACLLIAPSLPEIFKKIFGDEVWLVAPDRHSLFVFPPGQEGIGEFAEDLEERFDDNPFAATDEIFAAKSGEALRAVGSFRAGK